MADPPPMRDLTPALPEAFPFALTKGALVVLPQTKPNAPGTTGTPSGPKVLIFQYNPETITRTRTGEWEARKNQKGAPSPAQQSKQSSFQGGGLFAKSETIAMKLVFDVTERLLRSGVADDGLGVLPELAVLEQIAIASPPKDGPAANPQNNAKLNEMAPKELLLALGVRFFPVIVTSLTITEKRFNSSLIPVRAECDLQMQVLEATEVAGDPAIKEAFTKLIQDRKDRAAMAASTVPGSTLDAIATALRTPLGGQS
jgi:hypothetical protein